ncbi:MAG: tryptophan--tRNA ligase [Candidatus Curtissbacteria bacterium]|nr:tryptophan--tRNA ligase [Candidatus Curtissbacteria bacterium]
MKRILTGDRPTGRLHLGHYVGSLKNRVKLQHDYETFIMLADVQAMTDNFEHPEKLEENIRQVVLDYLSVGIDPKVSTIFIQSKIPEIAELTVFYMNLVTLARLQRNPTVKDEMKQKGFGANVPLGFLAYPVSQAADITFLKADLVPVGVDQIPMIEQTREIVRKFNELYGHVLIEPEALVGEVERLPGTDGKSKMSKSLGNVINLSDDSATVKKKVMSMYTDPNRIHGDEPGKVDGNPVFTYLDAFAGESYKSQVISYKEKYEKGTIKDVEVKEFLVQVLEEFLEPIRKRRAEFEAQPDLIDKILKEGTEKARKEAQETLNLVKHAMKIDYF